MIFENDHINAELYKLNLTSSSNAISLTELGSTDVNVKNTIIAQALAYTEGVEQAIISMMPNGYVGDIAIQGGADFDGNYSNVGDVEDLDE